MQEWTGGGQIGRRGGHRGEEEETVVGKINEKKKGKKFHVS